MRLRPHSHHASGQAWHLHTFVGQCHADFRISLLRSRVSLVLTRYAWLCGECPGFPVPSQLGLRFASCDTEVSRPLRHSFCFGASDAKCTNEDRFFITMNKLGTMRQVPASCDILLLIYVMAFETLGADKERYFERSVRPGALEYSGRSVPRRASQVSRKTSTLQAWTSLAPLGGGVSSTHYNKIHDTQWENIINDPDYLHQKRYIKKT